KLKIKKRMISIPACTQAKYKVYLMSNKFSLKIIIFLRTRTSKFRLHSALKIKHLIELRKPNNYFEFYKKILFLILLYCFNLISNKIIYILLKNLLYFYDKINTATRILK